MTGQDNEAALQPQSQPAARGGHRALSRSGNRIPEFASPFAPGQTDRYRPFNSNLSLPILVGPGGSLWEADAIACRLSRDAQSNFWRTGDDEPDMIRWLSWGKENFARASDMVHFERGTKQRYAHGPIDQGLVEEGLERFRANADSQIAPGQRSCDGFWSVS